MAEVARFRLGRRGLEVTAAVRPHSITLTFDFDRVYSFDLSGRLLTFFEKGTFYRRGLDHGLIRKARRGGEYVVERIKAADAPSTYEHIYAPLLEVNEAFVNGKLVCGGDKQPHRIIETVLSTIVKDPSALWADCERFRRVYSPVAILPPDQYLALVLQVTEGCSYNRCRFCSFYRDRPFRVKGLSEFHEHVRDVTDYFGAGISVRQSIFLADANGLVVERSKLEPIMKDIHERFFKRPTAGFKPRGIYSFVDTFHTEFGDPDVWRRYRQLGLKRVYMGVESGNDELLAAMGKPSTASSTWAAAQTLKSAGVQLGVIIITGLGGKAHEEQHIGETIRLLNRLPLDSHDLLLISPYVAEFAGDDMEEFGPVLSLRECELQRERIIAGMGAPRKDGRVRTATYSLREFIY